MDLEEFNYVFIEVLKTRKENRAFYTYTLSSIFENEKTYEEYLNELGLIREKEVNVNKVRKRANNVIDRIRKKVKK